VPVKENEKMPIDFIPANENNYEKNRRGHNINQITIHSIVGSLESCIRTFQEPKRLASAHYIVGWGGRVVEMVKDEDKAKHAGNLAGYIYSL
jgi:N-acetyl-anhydromuramyl-L-alanine amidase AmpD